MHRVVALAIIILLLAGVMTSCKKHYPTEPSKTDSTGDTTHHPCDTCNINQDSLQRVKDSLAHAFVWTECAIPGETNLTGVWVYGPNDIVIVGNTLWHYDGNGFHDLNPVRSGSGITLDGALSGFSMFALSQSEYWLVHGSIAFHTIYEGREFTDNRPGSVNAAWGSASNDVFFVGNAGQIHHYDGTKFTDMASPTTKDLRSVWGTSHNDVWACGYNSSKGQTVLIHFDGTTWSEDPISIQNNAITGGFDAVWACDSNGHRFVATSGALLIRKTDDGLWRSDSGLISNYLGGNSFIGIGPVGNTANDMMVVGPWGFISHWNGKDWKQFKELYDYNDPIYYTAAFSIHGNVACAVGSRRGTSWVAIGRRGK